MLSLVTKDDEYICLGEPGKIAGTSIPLINDRRVIWTTITANTDPHFNFTHLHNSENGSLDELAQKAGPNSKINCKAIISWYEDNVKNLSKHSAQSWIFPLTLYTSQDNYLEISIERNPLGWVSRNNSITGVWDSDRADGDISFIHGQEGEEYTKKATLGWVWSFNHREPSKLCEGVNKLWGSWVVQAALRIGINAALFEVCPELAAVKSTTGKIKKTINAPVVYYKTGKALIEGDVGTLTKQVEGKIYDKMWDGGSDGPDNFISIPESAGKGYITDQLKSQVKKIPSETINEAKETSY